MKKSNLDRTYPNRRNSDFRGFFQGTKSEKFRFSAMNFALFLCCYCLILIKLLKGSSSKYRTRQFNINVNSGENRKKYDFPLLEQREIVPERQRHPGAGSEGTSIQLRGSGKAQKPQDARPSLRLFALPRPLVMLPEGGF
jgi:hypothetical protein